MRRARFVAPARRELLAEVAYHNNKELGLGGLLLAAVKEATARALAYPLTGTPALEGTRRIVLKDFSSKTFPLRFLITHVDQSTGGTA